MAEPGGSPTADDVGPASWKPGALPLSILSPAEFLPFIRDVEQLAVAEKLAPVLVLLVAPLGCLAPSYRTPVQRAYAGRFLRFNFFRRPPGAA